MYQPYLTNNFPTPPVWQAKTGRGIIFFPKLVNRVKAHTQNLPRPAQPLQHPPNWDRPAQTYRASLLFPPTGLPSPFYPLSPLLVSRSSSSSPTRGSRPHSSCFFPISPSIARQPRLAVRRLFLEEGTTLGIRNFGGFVVPFVRRLANVNHNTFFRITHVKYITLTAEPIGW